MAATNDTKTIKFAAEERATGLVAFCSRQLDRIVSPKTRQKGYDHAAAFASERPVLFTFLLAQLLFSFLPLALFATFTVSVLAFALGAALVFSLFWVGVALLLLVPTLFLTVSVGVLVWAWAVSSFAVARWLYGFVPAGTDYKNQGLEVEVVKRPQVAAKAAPRNGTRSEPEVNGEVQKTEE